MSRIFLVVICASICLAQTDPFVTQLNIPVGDGTGSLTINDFNGDGKKDIAVMNPAANTITVLLGDGQGRFAPAPGGPLHFETVPHFVTRIVGNTSSPSFVTEEPLTSGDFNGDGKVDLAFTEHFSGSQTRMVVRFGAGDGTFLTSPIVKSALNAIPSTGTPSFDRLAAVDMNQDGKLDVVGDILVTSRISSTPTRYLYGLAYLGDGTGAFQSTAVGGSTATGDFNHDGRMDYVVGTPATGITINLANSVGGFTQFSEGFSNQYYFVDWITVVDYDHDGELDLLSSGLGSYIRKQPKSVGADYLRMAWRRIRRLSPRLPLLIGGANCGRF